MGMVLAGLLLCNCGRPPADGPPVVRTASFTFPALASVMAEVMRARGYDLQQGFRLEVRPFGTVAAYYAALTRAEVDTLAGGPLVLQRMRGQGIPVVIGNTYATLASLVVVSASSEVRELADLRGRTLAADLGSSEYTILHGLALARGLTPGRDFAVLQATPSVARAHLRTAEADAVLSFEPTATLILQDDPGHHLVFEGLREWERQQAGTGWLLVSLFHEEFAARSPQMVAAFGRALEASARFVHDSPEQADAIVAGALGLRPGVLEAAVRQGRVQFDVRPALGERAALEAMFRFGAQAGFSDHLPGEEAFFSGSAAASE